MKAHAQVIFHRNLKAKMKAHCDAKGIKWASHFADLIGLGGVNSAQYLRNIFNDDNKKLNEEQILIICNELDNHTNLKPYTQAEVQREVLSIVGKVGKISEKMTKHFDDKEEITLNEILPLVPDSRDLYALISELNFRLEETKAQL